jgi:hypothetical protein
MIFNIHLLDLKIQGRVKESNSRCICTSPLLAGGSLPSQGGLLSKVLCHNVLDAAHVVLGFSKWSR